jgi:hypothetical protein
MTETPINLTIHREIAIIWNVEDIRCLRPDLTDDQAWQLLQYAESTHDAGIGINWHTLESDAETLFGPEPEEGGAV